IKTRSRYRHFALISAFSLSFRPASTTSLSMISSTGPPAIPPSSGESNFMSHSMSDALQVRFEPAFPDDPDRGRDDDERCGNRQSSAIDDTGKIGDTCSERRHDACYRRQDCGE